jgi:hypothetical protein
VEDEHGIIGPPAPAVNRSIARLPSRMAMVGRSKARIGLPDIGKPIK